MLPGSVTPKASFRATRLTVPPSSSTHKKTGHAADLARVGLRAGEHRRRLLGVDDVLPEVRDAAHRLLEQGLPGGVARLGDQIVAGEVLGRHHEQLPDLLLQRHVRHELAGAGGGRQRDGLRDDGKGVGGRRGALPGPRLARRARLAVEPWGEQPRLASAARPPMAPAPPAAASLMAPRRETSVGPGARSVSWRAACACPSSCLPCPPGSSPAFRNQRISVGPL